MSFGYQDLEKINNDWKKSLKKPAIYILILIVLFIVGSYLYGFISKKGKQLATTTNNDISKNIPIVHHKSDTTIKFSIEDLNKIHNIDTKQNVTVYLPAVNKSNIGAWVEIVKLNTGYILIKTVDDDKVANFFKSNCVRNFTWQMGSNVKLKLINPTTWQSETSSPSSWLPDNIEQPYFPQD